MVALFDLDTTFDKSVITTLCKEVLEDNNDHMLKMYLSDETGLDAMIEHMTSCLRK